MGDAFPTSERASHRELASTVYAHLRAMAQRQMKGERPGNTLSATALVHEAYLRLGGAELVGTVGEEAFYNAAAQAMRRILIERARARGRVKRGGGALRLPLEAVGDVADLDALDEAHGEGILAFEDVFRRLEEYEPRVAEVVRMRFFAGLSVPETARALGISERTVNNRWAYSRAWLARELGKSGALTNDAATRHRTPDRDHR
jgi:RNA polymerase sigma factor (TIGR02999 family)